MIGQKESVIGRLKYFGLKENKNISYWNMSDETKLWLKENVSRKCLYY